MMIENATNEEIAKLGKYGLIDLLSEKFESHNSSTIYGSGYQAAVIDTTPDYVVSATKVLLENIHFDRTYFDLKLLGYKALAVTIADLLAMNALPRQFQVNMAVSNRYDHHDLNLITMGMMLCADRYHVDLAGMDITTSQTGLVLSMTVLGDVSPDKLVSHKGARDKELICVSGDLAAAYAGLLLLEREKKVFDVNPNQQPVFDGVEYLLERQLKPEPRVDIIESFEKEGIIPTAMVNVKEGLSAALFHICNGAKVGCRIFENKLPIHALTFTTLRDLKIVATTIALSGGEDYELLFTVKQADYERLKKINDIAVIGFITPDEKSRCLITADDRQIELKAQGFPTEQE